MRANRLRFVSCTFAVLLCGCSGSERQPPSPAPPVNAAVDSYAAIYRDFRPTADNSADVVVGRCASSKEFAKKRKGNWEDHWFVVRIDILSVEEGTWPEPEVSFICADSWPTPESGIMLGKAAWPYRAGVRMRFWLDTKSSPARIVGQETLFDPFAASSTQQAE